MPELEAELLDLGRSIAWPPTPAPLLPIQREVAPSAGGAAGRGAAVPRRIPRWTLAAAALLLIIAALAFSWIGLHTTIYRVPNPPAPPAHSPGSLGSNLFLGTRTTLHAAQGQVNWTIRVPSALGAPDAVYVKLPPDGPSQGEVTLVYAHAAGIKASGQTGVAVLVTEARGSVNETFFEKMIGPSATVEFVTAGGHSGYWISGHPHDFLFVGADGQVQDDSLRLATNTLIFDFDGTIVRVEGDMTEAQALAIAGT